MEREPQSIRGRRPRNEQWNTTKLLLRIVFFLVIIYIWKLYQNS